MLRYDLPRVAKASLVLVDCGAVFFGSTLLKEFLDKRTLIANTEVTYSEFQYILDSHVRFKVWITVLLKFLFFYYALYTFTFLLQFNIK